MAAIKEQIEAGKIRNLTERLSSTSAGESKLKPEAMFSERSKYQSTSERKVS